jgi:PAS domain S-box-containing protein
MRNVAPSAWMRARLVLAALAVIACTLIPLSAAVSAEAKIRVLAGQNNPPFSYLEDGQPAGFDVDVLKAIGEITRREIQIELLPWDVAQRQVLERSADALSGFAITGERRLHWEFTRPVLTHSFSLFVRAGEIAIRGTDDLSGRRVACWTSGITRTYLEAKSGIVLVPLTDDREGFRRLQAGEVDAVATDTMGGAYLLSQTGTADITVAGEPFATLDLAIAAPRGSADLVPLLDQALADLETSGKLAQIRRRWEPKQTVFLQKEDLMNLTALAALALVALILIGFSAWVITLRQEVRRREKITAELGASEQRFRVLVEHAPEGIIVWDADAGHMTDANPNMERITGYNRKELLQLKIEELYAREQPDQLPLDRTFHTNIERALQGEQLFFVRRLRKRDSTELLCEVRLVRLPSAHRRLLRASFVDITERRQVENALRLRQAKIESLFRGSPLGMGEISDRKLTLVNERICEITGYSAEELVGKGTRALYASDEEYERVGMELYRQVKEKGLGHVETQLRRKNGTLIDMLISVSPVLPTEPEGDATTIVQDITEQKKARRELEAAYARLRQLSSKLLDAQESERRNLARELHDEVGQALTAVKLKLEGTRRSTADAGASAQLASCVEIADTALQQVRNLSLDLRPPQLDLMGLESALRWLLETRVEAVGLSTSLNVRLTASEISPQIEITCFRIVQEALTNALRHARAKSVQVDVEQDDDFIEVTVRDDGVGFDADAAMEKAAAGGSLGLLSMEERLVLLGGSFSIASEAGVGTRVRGRIPVGSAAPAAASVKGEF